MSSKVIRHDCCYVRRCHPGLALSGRHGTERGEPGVGDADQRSPGLAAISAVLLVIRVLSVGLLLPLAGSGSVADRGQGGGGQGGRALRQGGRRVATALD